MLDKRYKVKQLVTCIEVLECFQLIERKGNMINEITQLDIHFLVTVIIKKTVEFYENCLWLLRGKNLS